MQRLAVAILAVVTMFVVVVGITLVVRSRSARVEPTATSSNADLTIKEVDVREEAGKVRWRLTAKQALVFEREGRTALREIAVEVHEPDRTWSIVGEEGDLNQQKKDVEIRKHVVVTSSDGLRLETDLLRWTGEERRLWTDAPVKIVRPGAVIVGGSLDVRMAEATTTLRGGVRAIFEPDALR